MTNVRGRRRDAGGRGTEGNYSRLLSRESKYVLYIRVLFAITVEGGPRK
jgi:hypothetical protein